MPPLMYKTQNLHKSDLYEHGINELYDFNISKSKFV